MESLYPQFDQALVLGKYNEEVIAHEFYYQGVPLVRTEGKHPFDFYLPDGRSLEIKIDVRSQCTNAGAVEWPTLQRMADLYLYTFTYNRIYTHKELEQLYLSGKVPSGGFGDLGYTGRYIQGMGKHGKPGYQFIRELKMAA
jgi:hypothetical protein